MTHEWGRKLSKKRQQKKGRTQLCVVHITGESPLKGVVWDTFIQPADRTHRSLAGKKVTERELKRPKKCKKKDVKKTQGREVLSAGGVSLGGLGKQIPNSGYTDAGDITWCNLMPRVVVYGTYDKERRRKTFK